MLGRAMRSPRKLNREEDLYAAALRALMRRAHSVYEMRQALERRAEDTSLVPRVMARLKEQKYLDDARYARQFARQQAETRRRGRFRIARDLRARGVADRHIEAALNEVLADVDETAQVRKRIERRLRQMRGGLDERTLASLYRALLRAGFPTDTIRCELRALTKRDVEEPQESAEENSG